MIAHKIITLPNGFTFTIIELDEPTVQKNFNNRFQVALEAKGKRFFPKLKKRFFEFYKNYYFYDEKSDLFNKYITLDEVTYHMKQVCDKSREECLDEIEEYVTMYNNGEDIQEVLIKNFIL